MYSTETPQRRHDKFRQRVLRARRNDPDMPKSRFCKRFKISEQTLEKWLQGIPTYHPGYVQAARALKPPQPVEVVVRNKEMGREFCSKCRRWSNRAEFLEGASAGQYHRRRFCIGKKND